MTGPYTVGATYQENLLPAQQVKQGHEVVMYATSYEWADGKVKYVGECRRILDDGVILQRIDFTTIINDYLSRKIRLCTGLYNRLVKETPDFIMVHDGQTACVLDICKYVADNPQVVLIADSHSDYYNSATSIPSKLLLHDLIYRPLMRKLYGASKKFYCISPEVMRFICKSYGLDKTKMELLPLGGELLSDDEYDSFRKDYRRELGIPDDGINIIHSGKMTFLKGSDKVVEAVEAMQNEKVYLTLVGSASGEILECIEAAAERNPKIRYLGWKSGDELVKYLCAADIYVLPGSQSATVQNSMCCRCAVELYPYDNYKSLKQDGVCYAIDGEELIRNLTAMCNDRQLLDSLKDISYKFAKHELDYAVQAKRIINDNI